MYIGYLFFLALGYNDYNPAGPFSSSPSHPLHQSDGTFVSIKADNEVHLSNVQTLLSHTRGY